MNGERFVTPAALAAARGVTAHAVRFAITEGILPAQNLLGRWLIAEADAEAWYPKPRGGPGRGQGRKPKKQEGDE